MKLIYKHKNIFMIFFLCLSFVLSLYIVYKEIVYFNNIENFENPNNNQQQPAQLTPEQVRQKKQQGLKKLEDSGFLKVINIDHENKAATKNLETQLDSLSDREYKLSQKLKNFSIKVEARRTELGRKAMSQTLDVMSHATSHLKPVTDAIKKHAGAINGPPPAHLDNDPKSTDPDKPYDPTKPASWWSGHGSTPEFYKGNYIPIAATNCSLPQCAPDGFAMAN
jgi:hypothetical protein